MRAANRGSLCQPMKQPLLLPATLLAAGVAMQEFFGGRIAWLFLIAAVVLVLAAVVPRLRQAALVAACLLVGWLGYAVRQTPVAAYDLRRLVGTNVELVTLRGVIVETPTLRLVERRGGLAGRTMVTVMVQALRRGGEWLPAAGGVAVSTPGPLPAGFFRTQRVELTGVLRRPPGPTAEDLFDYRTFLRRQSVWFTLQAEGPQDWRRMGDAVTTPPLSERFLPWAQTMLSRGLPDDETTRLLAAMALGWKTPLTGEVDEVFMESGTMHVFAISGLHIALIAGLLVQLLRLVRLSRAWCGLVAVPLIWFYVAATGWQSSAIRSAIMTTVVVGGWALERPGDLINSLAAAAVAILVWDPGQLFQASFQLSFGAVAGLALLVPVIEPVFLRWARVPPDPFLPDALRPRWQRCLESGLRPLAMSLAVCVAAFFSSLPLTWHYFHLLNPVSLLANLLVVPLSSLALAANFAALTTGPWWPWLGEVFNASAWVWLHWMVRLSRWFAALPGGHWYLAAPAWGWWGPYYLLLLAGATGWGRQPGRRRWWLAGLSLWLAAAATGFGLRQRETRITVLRGGEAVFLDAPWWRNDVLLDAGSESGASGEVIPFLRAQGVNRLPLFAAVTADVRHLGGASNVLRELRPLGAVLGPAKPRGKAFNEFLHQAELREIPLRPTAAGGEFAGWQVLHPAEDDKSAAADDHVLALARNLGGLRVLLLGDLGNGGQRRLLARGGLRADLVVAGVPHAGEPLGDPLLAAIAPQVIVVASGDYPAQLRVKPATRARLAQRGCHVVYTCDSAAVTLRFAGGGCEVRAMDGTRFRIAPAAAP